MHLTSLSFAYPDVSADERAGILQPEQPTGSTGPDAFFLATCLRVEIAWQGGPELAPVVLEDLFGPGPLPTPKMRTDLDGFLHLCRVAAGLESAPVGEAEVLSQFKDAVERLAVTGRADAQLLTTLENAIGVARATRKALGGDGKGSLAGAAARLVESREHVIVLGGGAMARAVVRALNRSDLSVFARRPMPVAGHPPRPWDGLARALESCSAVVSTVPGPVPALQGLDGGSDVVVVDLGMPPAASRLELEGTYRYHGVDQVAATVESAPEPAAEEIVIIEAERAWGRLSVSDRAGHLITSIVDRVERTVDEEIRRFAGRLPGASDPEPVLRQLAHTVARRIVHPSISLLGSTPLEPASLEIIARGLGVADE